MSSFDRKVRRPLEKMYERANTNIKKVAQNLPLVERKLDVINASTPFVFEFNSYSDNAPVTIDLYVKSTNCCNCKSFGNLWHTRTLFSKSPIYTPPPYDFINNSRNSYIQPPSPYSAYIAYWNNTRFYPGGTSFPAYQGSVIPTPGQNWWPFFGIPKAYGNFTLTSDVTGFTAPINGAYDLSYSEQFNLGSTLDLGYDAYVTLYIRVNNNTISKRTWSFQQLGDISTSTYSSTYGSIFITNVQIYANCYNLKAGDVVSCWLEYAPPILVYDPYTFSGDESRNFRAELLGTGWGSLTGIVRDSVTSQPIAGASVRHTITGGQEVFTDVNGNYSFDVMTPGEYNIQYYKTGYTPINQYVNVLWGVKTTLNAAMSPA